MKWNVCVAAIVRNEEQYIRSWVNYYLSLGVDHVYIYDNLSTDATVEILQTYVAHGRATVLNWPLQGGQIDAYNHALRVFGHTTEWLGFLDIDEFVVLHNHHALFEYLVSTSADQVLLPWQNFPYNGHQRAPGGASLENFLYAFRVPPGGGSQVKHFVRPEVAVRATAHFSFTSSGKTVLGDGSASRETHLVIDPSYRGAQVNHYATRSVAENQARLQKGQVSGSAHKRPDDFHLMTRDLLQNLVYDKSIFRHLPSYRIEEEKWRRLSPTPHRFGLMQTRSFLKSWNGVIFYVAKSFGNYLLGETDIKPTSRFPFIRVEAGGGELDISTVIIDYPGPFVTFKVPEHPEQRSFVGTVHYGDVLRRFGGSTIVFDAGIVVQNKWKREIKTSFSAHLVILHIEAKEPVEYTFETTGNVSQAVGRTIPVGRHCLIHYRADYDFEDTLISVGLSGACTVREVVALSLA
jgi:hypothetical protein